MQRNHRKELDTHRGVSEIQCRPGLTQVHVELDRERLEDARLDLLQAIADDDLSLNFVKLTPAGISFLIREAIEDRVSALLRSRGLAFEIIGKRSFVVAHAPNMRDEPGLIAEIVHTTIGSGFEVDQVGDMHDRVLMIVPSESGEALAELLRARLIKGSA